MCGAGYTGVVAYSSIGQPTGCNQCGSNYWSVAGNGNTCVPITCTISSSYTGNPGSCMCAAGFYGSVRYVNGNVTGCVPCPSNAWSIAGNGLMCTGIPCSSSVGYTGIAGYCGCSAGYTGKVTYSSGSLFGCSPCPSNKWSDPGLNKLCSDIPCSKSPGYEGEGGNCTCSAGYYEVSPVSFSLGYPVGCGKCPEGDDFIVCLKPRIPFFFTYEIISFPYFFN